MDSDANQSDRPDLDTLRARLDEIDRRLVTVLADRGRVIEDVIHYKRAHQMRVVDRAREDRMLDHIAVVAESEGLDPRVAQHVLRAIIDAFTLVEAEELEPE